MLGVSPPLQTAVARLLQDRREAAGFSRARLGALIGVSAGTIEGWELSRVTKPPLHDVLRVAHFLRIPYDDLLAAVLSDSGAIPDADPGEEKPKRRKSGRRAQGAVPVLEAAFRLFEWDDEDEAAYALGVTAERVRRWRRGLDRLELSDYMSLSSLVGAEAARILRHEPDRADALALVAETLGVQSPGS